MQAPMGGGGVIRGLPWTPVDSRGLPRTPVDSRGLPWTVAEPADSLLRGLYIVLKATRNDETAWFYLPVRPLGVQTTSAASREPEESSKLHPGRWSLARARISCEYVSGPLQIPAITIPIIFIETYRNQCKCLLLAPRTCLLYTSPSPRDS